MELPFCQPQFFLPGFVCSVLINLSNLLNPWKYMTSYICRLHDEMLIVDYIHMQCVCYRRTDHNEGLQPMMNIQLDNFKSGVYCLQEFLCLFAPK